MLLKNSKLSVICRLLLLASIPCVSLMQPLAIFAGQNWRNQTSPGTRDVPNLLSSAYVQPDQAVSTIAGDCVANDTALFQAAIDTAPNYSRLVLPTGKCMKITAPIKIYGRKGLIIDLGGPIDPYNNDQVAVTWAGANNAIIFDLRNSGSCAVINGRISAGTATGIVLVNSDHSLDTRTYGKGVNTSNTFSGLLLSSTQSSANTVGIRISHGSSENGERMFLHDIACGFSPASGANASTNVNRGRCLKLGDEASNMGFNAVNIVVQRMYAFGVSYPIDIFGGGEILIQDYESNFSTTDILNLGFSNSSVTVMNARTEQARQFTVFNGAGEMTLDGVEVGGWADWNLNYPAIAQKGGHLTARNVIFNDGGHLVAGYCGFGGTDPAQICGGSVGNGTITTDSNPSAKYYSLYRYDMGQTRGILGGAGFGRGYSTGMSVFAGNGIYGINDTSATAIERPQLARLRIKTPDGAAAKYVELGQGVAGDYGDALKAWPVAAPGGLAIGPSGSSALLSTIARLNERTQFYDPPTLVNGASVRIAVPPPALIGGNQNYCQAYFSKFTTSGWNISATWIAGTGPEVTITNNTGRPEDLPSGTLGVVCFNTGAITP
jgi:hypothetical protein